VTTHKLRHAVGETSLPQVAGANGIMVDYADPIIMQAFLIQEVTDVVQQSRDDHFRVAAGVSGKLRTLQGVFKLRDRFPKVCRLAGPFQQFHDLIHASIGGDGHHRNILSKPH
jgi:hypothetical protein